MRVQGVVVLCVLLFGSGTFAQDVVSTGRFQVRADSPLGKGEYPRLMVTRVQLPAIRARLEHPEIQTYLKQARNLVAIGKASPLLLAALYQLTGDEQYANLAKERLGDPNWDPKWTFAFDMIAETMAGEQRAEFAAMIGWSHATGNVDMGGQGIILPAAGDAPFRPANHKWHTMSAIIPRALTPTHSGIALTTVIS